MFENMETIWADIVGSMVALLVPQRTVPCKTRLLSSCRVTSIDPAHELPKHQRKLEAVASQDMLAPRFKLHLQDWEFLFEYAIPTVPHISHNSPGRYPSSHKLTTHVGAGLWNYSQIGRCSTSVETFDENAQSTVDVITGERLLIHSGDYYANTPTVV
jgi:hypothetical protein